DDAARRRPRPARWRRRLRRLDRLGARAGDDRRVRPRRVRPGAVHRGRGQGRGEPGRLSVDVLLEGLCEALRLLATGDEDTWVITALTLRVSLTATAL